MQPCSKLRSPVRKPPSIYAREDRHGGQAHDAELESIQRSTSGLPSAQYFLGPIIIKYLASCYSSRFFLPLTQKMAKPIVFFDMEIGGGTLGVGRPRAPQPHAPIPAPAPAVKCSTRLCPREADTRPFRMLLLPNSARGPHRDGAPCRRGA